MTVTDTRFRSTWLAPLGSSLLCLLPLILQWNRFRILYWFHDDWDQMSEMQRLGTAAWIAQPFPECFVPVFKVAWAAAIPLVHGSYFGLILALWGTHLSILLLLAAVLRRCGFSSIVQSLAVLTLGLAWCNIETLGWATQWSSLLATLFLLCAWLLLMYAAPERSSAWVAASAIFCALASAFSFSRGVITGALLAFFVLRWPDIAGGGIRRRAWIPACLVSITLASLLADYSLVQTHENLQGVGLQKVGSMASYAVWYALINPLFHLLPIPRKAVDLTALMIAGTCKVLIMAWALSLAKGSQRALLWTLLVLDLATAGLLGMGRSDLGAGTTVSYRYQYISLLCFAPFLAVAGARIFQYADRPSPRRAAFGLAVFAWALLLGYPWARHMERWSQWRGMAARAALTAAPQDQRFGLPSITAGRARELINVYGLH